MSDPTPAAAAALLKPGSQLLAHLTQLLRQLVQLANSAQHDAQLGSSGNNSSGGSSSGRSSSAGPAAAVDNRKLVEAVGSCVDLLSRHSMVLWNWMQAVAHAGMLKWDLDNHFTLLAAAVQAVEAAVRGASMQQRLCALAAVAPPLPLALPAPPAATAG